MCRLIYKFVYTIMLHVLNVQINCCRWLLPCNNCTFLKSRARESIHINTSVSEQCAHIYIELPTATTLNNVCTRIYAYLLYPVTHSLQAMIIQC